MSQAKTKVFSVVQQEQLVPAHVRLDACVLLIGCGPRFLTGRRKRLEDVAKLSQELRETVTEERWPWDTWEQQCMSTLVHTLRAFLSFKHELALERETRMAGARRAVPRALLRPGNKCQPQGRGTPVGLASSFTIEP